MDPVRDDLVETWEHVGGRLLHRMAGLTEAEWRRQPAADARLSLRWRLDHLAEVLWAERNTVWLGTGIAGAPGPPATSAGEAVDRVRRGLAHVTGMVRELTDPGLLAPVGAAAGGYAAATRLSFVLHLLDEFIHHSAEAALLRDLCPGIR
ncbi:DinB family protein [Actinoplanes sp. N902-109]|uniref:DinB family protein n=1 Tax=Actinoplanes sp. (strain N902-109) TaxID=649831 RepID=UPI00032943AC|nr:DinB family protein [Actinoplanes sp. N902-109]AGL17593.1 hypothetical protein L083_4083 [Actinoplanes sp. N902-109]